MRSRMQFAAYPEDRVPEGLRAALDAPRPMFAEEPRAPAPVAPRRRRRNDVRAMRRVGTVPFVVPVGPSVSPAPGGDAPLVVGIAVLVCPPVGVTLLWASARFSYEAKIAITCFAAWHAMLVAVVMVAALR